MMMENNGLRAEEKDVNLLKLNYEKLHESIWNNHKLSWTVTSIFIPVLFAVQGYFIKEYYAPQDIRVIFGVIGMEFLLIVWLLVMRIFRHYNVARRERLKEIEKIFDDLISKKIKDHFTDKKGFNLYNLPLKEN